MSTTTPIPVQYNENPACHHQLDHTASSTLVTLPQHESPLQSSSLDVKNMNNNKNNNTTDFQPITLPDTNYRTGTILNATGFRVYYAMLHLLFCFSNWFLPILSPIVLIALLWFGFIKTTLVIIAFGVYPFIFKPGPSLLYRRLVLRMGEPLAQWRDGFTVYYQHGSYELLNKHKRADYLQYDITKHEATTTQSAVVNYKDKNKKEKLPFQSECEIIYPDDAFTTTYSTQHDTINNNTTWPAPGEISLYQQLPHDEQLILRKPIMIVSSPHGVFSAGFNYGGVCCRSLDNCNPDIAWLCADNLTKAPFFEWIMQSYNKLQSAAAPNMKRLMAAQRDVALLPGGFNEASFFEFGKYKIYIKKRQGFMKYALQFGYNIIPMFTFGEERMYHNVKGLTELRETLSNWNIPTILPFGQWWCPLLPKVDQGPVQAVYGKPLFLPHIPEPTSEEVAYWHSIYIQRVQELFDENIKKFKLDERKGVDNTLYIC